MNTIITERLIQSIKKSLPDNIQIVSYITDLLSMSRQAAYRRMNGEVPFTLDEVVTIADDLKLSLDRILERKDTKRAVFNLNLIDYNDPMENYYKILKGYIDIFETMAKNADASINSAFNIIPYSFSLNYDHISKFLLYKWLCISKVGSKNIPYSQFGIPTKIKNIQQKHFHTIRLNIDSTFILDKNVFTSFAGDVMYFYQLQLLNDEEKDQLRKELLKLVAYIEELTSSGKNNTGSKVSIYISNINLDTSYTLYKSGDFEMAHFRIFSINAIESRNQLICRIQKEWLESLRDHSTLITQSSYLQRSLFFAEQYERINKIFESEIVSSIY